MDDPQAVPGQLASLGVSRQAVAHRVVFWEGDRLRGHNFLRRLIYRHKTPLMDHSVDPMHWTGYQFHRDDLGEGMVLLFRRARSPYPAVQIRLRDLCPEETYELTFVDMGDRRTLAGPEVHKPIRIEIDESPGSVLMTYRRAENR